MNSILPPQHPYSQLQYLLHSWEKTFVGVQLLEQVNIFFLN